MRIVKLLAGAIVAFVLVLVAVGFFARFGDGPTAIFPGGPLVSGELYSGPEPDWTFAKDYPELELQLVEPPVSRIVWLQVVDGKLYLISGYMNSTVGKLWKHWPMQAEKDPRVVIRLDGKRYERKLVRLGPDHPALPAILAEVVRKYGAELDPNSAPQIVASGDAWVYAVARRDGGG